MQTPLSDDRPGIFNLSSVLRCGSSSDSFGGSPVESGKKRGRQLDYASSEDGYFKLSLDRISTQVEQCPDLVLAIGRLLEGENEFYVTLSQGWPLQKGHLAVLLCLDMLRDFYTDHITQVRREKRAARDKLSCFVTGRYTVVLTVTYDGAKQVCAGGSTKYLTLALKNIWQHIYANKVNTAECFIHAGLCDFEDPVNSFLRIVESAGVAKPHYWIREVEPCSTDYGAGLLMNAANYSVEYEWFDDDTEYFRAMSAYSDTLYKQFCYAAFVICGCRGEYYGKPLL